MTRTSGRLLIATAVVTIGCGSRGKDPAVCRAEAHELAAFLGSFDHTPTSLAPGTALVQRTDLPRATPPAAPVIAVAERVGLDGADVADGAELADRLRAVAARIAADGARRNVPVDPGRVLLAIDLHAPWSTVVWVADAALAAGFDHPALVFARPPDPVTPPPPSSIDAELARIVDGPGDDKAVRLAALASRVVEPCPALTRVFGAVARPDADDKAQVLIDGIEPALIACGCHLDVPALRTLMFRLLYVPNPTTALAIALAADGRAVALPATTPWATAYPQVTAGAPLRLTIAP